jgi:pantoate--beta-alanine ligase
VKVARTAAEFRAASDELRAAQPRGLALVPTMGALHEGHRTLMRVGRREAGAVAVTIFVNPTQFGPNEDFSRYPRDLDGDLAACAAEGIELVFAPAPEEVYPRGDATRVRVERLTERLCGPLRPGHFEGVATVVAKLLAVTGPCTAIFGRKDYQQLKVVERLARDLLLPVTIVGQPTIRDADGLALSSRNRYLSPAERAQALAIPRALARAAATFAGGERDPVRLREAAHAVLAASELRLQYLEVLDADELALPSAGSTLGVFIAGHIGKTRLIDNSILGVDAPPEA